MPPRAIALRTRGHRGGPITRLVSPGDLGRLVKPFVFLDLFRAERRFIGSMPIHPHSGIATVTVLTEGDLTWRSGTVHAAGGLVQARTLCSEGRATQRLMAGFGAGRRIWRDVSSRRVAT